MVVDDEAPARSLLRRKLEGFSEVQEVIEAEGAQEALNLLEKQSVEVLFLDIAMPEMDGMALASEYSGLPPIVFVTAHQHHALQAFEVGAADYVLKPVRKERLHQAILRAAQRKGQPGQIPKAVYSSSMPKVVTKCRGVVHIFPANEIDRFFASEKYTVFQVDGQEHLSSEPLSKLEERLQGHGFLRVHRGELVRLAAISALKQYQGTWMLVLRDGQEASVSRRHLGKVKQILQELA